MKLDIPPRCIILGGGGHARMLIDCLLSAHMPEPLVVLDHDQTLWGRKILGVAIAGGEEQLPEFVSQGARWFIVGVGSIESTRRRRLLFELGNSHRLEPMTVVHPSVICSSQAVISPGAQLLPGSIINVGARIGANAIVNSGAIVEHDCEVGDHAHIASGARLGGTVSVGTGAHIGSGATIRQGIRIGDGAVVGSGAVVVKDVPPGMVVAGVPARILRPVKESA